MPGSGMTEADLLGLLRWQQRRPRFVVIVSVNCADFRAIRIASSSNEVDQCRAEAATALAARSRGCGCTARAGSEVSKTQIVCVAGSVHAIVPVDPV